MGKAESELDAIMRVNPAFRQGLPGGEYESGFCYGDDVTLLLSGLIPDAHLVLVRIGGFPEVHKLNKVAAACIF